MFDHAHRLAFDLLARGLVQGLRIDHVDGLFNPAAYLRLVQGRAGRAVGRPPADPEDQPIWLAVEKVLAADERIRRDWPVAGTTGYDFLNQVAGLFVDPEGERGVTAAYLRFVGAAVDFHQEVVRSKRQVMATAMASELRVLALRLSRIAVSHWRSRDFTLSVLFTALAEVVACLPVYRTYITSRRVTDTDRRYIGQAVDQARRLSGGDPSVFDFVEGVLETALGRDEDGAYSRRAVVDFAMRLQQYSGPVMAKGVEDTAYYRYNRLICLNEVGGDPTRFGLSASGFHQAVRARQRSHPHAMLATATHDTKRGEDTRLRIAMLSGIADEWSSRIERWRRFNGQRLDAEDEMLVYQTLVGAWADDDPQFEERLRAAAVKSVREAKRRTSWARPDQAYEKAVGDFVGRICRDKPFLEDFRPFQRRVAWLGMLAGLAQTLLKLTCPGVPDIYQGCELWDLSLVDPDNRRAVDWALRRRMLGRLAGAALPADPESWRDGGVKQELIRRVLGLRRRLPALFDDGAYRPLTVRGGDVLAFARQDQEHAVVVAVPLRPAALWPVGHELPPLGPAWRGLHVETPRRGAASRWRNLLTGAEVVPVSRRGTPVLFGPDLFAAFPLALLEEAKSRNANE